MAVDITIKNMPSNLYKKLKDLHKRVPPIPAHFSTDKFLRKAKEEGRP